MKLTINKVYLKSSNYFKTLSDPNRLIIIDMLKGSELCACKILEKLAITQSTLSHHMRILCDVGLVNARREGKWMHYSLNTKNFANLKTFLDSISNSENNHIYNY